jgi:hypothetical protein
MDSNKNELVEKVEKPENAAKFNMKNVRYSDYASTLIKEAVNCGIFSTGDLNRINNETAEVLKECGSKSAEAVLIAQGKKEYLKSIYLSMMYTVDAYLLTLNSVWRSLDALKSTAFGELYQRGRKQLKILLCESASLYVKARKTRVHTVNIPYNNVFSDVMTVLKNYNMDCTAHLCGKFDYPLMLPCNNNKGIYYIKNYLTRLYSENQFCGNYDADEIDKLYKKLCRRKKVSALTVRANIYEAVYCNAVFADYLMKDSGDLAITYDDCDIIQKLLEGQPPDVQADIIKSAAMRLNYGSSDYNEKTLSLYVPKFVCAINEKTLRNLLVAEL